tara:strand:+ start:428 stop:730 length:303 start_codon:yes stop_codon:yes gene_type:complete
MADLPNPPLLTADGDYDFPTQVGEAYLLTLKGTFGGATVTMKTRSDVVAATYDAVTDGAFTADAEVNFRAPSLVTRLTVSGAGGSTAIRVTRVKHVIKGN